MFTGPPTRAKDVIQGVWEKDPVRKEDSFVSFEEVMQKAVEMDVDMVLLGGDLFHDNKPSRATVRVQASQPGPYAHTLHPSLK